MYTLIPKFRSHAKVITAHLPALAFSLQFVTVPIPNKSHLTTALYYIITLYTKFSLLHLCQHIINKHRNKIRDKLHPWDTPCSLSNTSDLFPSISTALLEDSCTPSVTLHIFAYKQSFHNFRGTTSIPLVLSGVNTGLYFELYMCVLPCQLM